jgi:acetyl-CoA carboxylase carboxyltransferase component
MWQKETDELKQRRKLARQMGRAEAIARQHSRGRLTVRERIDALFDRGTFKEIGTLAGRAEYDDKGELKSFTHMPRVMGYGKINGRPVCVEGTDFTIHGG